MVLLRKGRLRIIFEPRDLWIGLYIGLATNYFVPFPMIVFAWRKK